MSALAHLLYGALIPTLAMVNFPQAILLATISVTYLVPWRRARLAVLAAHPALISLTPLAGDLKEQWFEIGNVAWPAIFALWLPLWVIAAVV
jgi:glycosylphosphatidylinositol transamidase